MVFDTIRNDLADTFVDNVTAGDGAEISDFRRGVNLRNESKHGVVERLKDFSRREELLNHRTDIGTHNIPSRLEELSREAIRARGFIITHLKQDALNLFIRNMSKHVGRLKMGDLIGKEGRWCANSKGGMGRSQ
ncbi:hypothetical protein L2E82_35628 [Cichorium intybus]|uniref:Uncharacterized protein n=1 Tax=Cichorium intybus TaxID=13427 RepID=A0ACB9BPD5_CICIN|nr:hypothetical protein L2E82_35628 [Cichorium intybus]